MRQHYGLDKLVSYETEAVPDTTKVINPTYRQIVGNIRKKASRLQRLAAQFGGLGLEGEIVPGKVEAYENRKAELQEEIAHLNQELTTLKGERKNTTRHITFGELPEEARFERLAVHNKHMIDTIKMVAHLCTELNATETVYPGTNLRMIYELVTSKNPGDKEFWIWENLTTPL